MQKVSNKSKKSLQVAVDNIKADIYSSRPRQTPSPAQVVKLVDTLASGASGLTAVEVQVLSWAPNKKASTRKCRGFLVLVLEQQRTSSHITHALRHPIRLKPL